MIGRSLNGYRVVRCVGVKRPIRVRTWLPSRKSFFYLLVRDTILFYSWTPHEGLYLVRESHVDSPTKPRVRHPARVKALTVKKREALGLTGVALPGPSPTSVI